MRCESGLRTEPQQFPHSIPCATHQLLRGCVLDESRAMARSPGACDPHPWERQGTGVPSAWEGLGKHSAQGWTRVCP